MCPTHVIRVMKITIPTPSLSSQSCKGGKLSHNINTTFSYSLRPPKRPKGGAARVLIEVVGVS